MEKATGYWTVLLSFVFILLLTGVPFFFIGGPAYHTARSFKECWNLGHVLFFFLATWLVVSLRASRQLPQKDWFFFIWVFLGVLGSGICIELLQKASGGRAVDGWDLYRNQLGCLAAFVCTASLPLTQKGNRLLMLMLTGLLLVAARPLYQALADEQAARNQFPVLSDFETPFEQMRWRDIHQLSRQQKFVRHGRYGLRVQLSTATYSGTSLFYFPHDWRDYKRLYFSVFIPDTDFLFLHCRINDTLHNQHGLRFDDRFHKRFTLQPGWNDLSVALQDVRTAPATRLMDMEHIEGLGLFVIRQKRTHVLYLDHVYLSR